MATVDGVDAVVTPLKAIEDGAELLRGNACAVVAHPEHEPVITQGTGDLDVASLIAEVDRIAEQVGQYQLDVGWIALEHEGLGILWSARQAVDHREVEAFLAQLEAKALHDPLYEGTNVRVQHLRASLTGLELGREEDVTELKVEAEGLGVYQGHHGDYLLPRLLIDTQYRPGQAQYRGEGIDDLVGDIADEVALELFRFLELLVDNAQLLIQARELLHRLVGAHDAAT